MSSRISSALIKEEPEETVVSSSSVSHWRSSLRKKLSRLSSKKKRPTSLHFDVASPSSIGQSCQSLFYTDFVRTKTFSSNSLISRDDFPSRTSSSKANDLSVFYPNDDDVRRKEEGRPTSPSLSHFVFKSHDSSRVPFKDRIKKFVKKGHLSASITSISNKFKENFQSSHEIPSMFASMKSRQNKSCEFVHHLRDSKQLTSDLSENSSECCQVLRDFSDLVEIKKDDAFTVDDSESSFRHIDSSSDEESTIEPTNHCVNPSRMSLTDGHDYFVQSEVKPRPLLLKDRPRDWSNPIVNSGTSDLCKVGNYLSEISPPSKLLKLKANEKSATSVRSRDVVKYSFIGLGLDLKIPNPFDEYWKCFTLIKETFDTPDQKSIRRQSIKLKCSRSFFRWNKYIDNCIRKKSPTTDTKTMSREFKSAEYLVSFLSLKVFEFDSDSFEQFVTVSPQSESMIEKRRVLNISLPDEIIISACISLKNPVGIFDTKLLFKNTTIECQFQFLLEDNGTRNVPWLRDIRTFLQRQIGRGERCSKKLKEHVHTAQEIDGKLQHPLNNSSNLGGGSTSYQKLSFPSLTFTSSEKLRSADGGSVAPSRENKTDTADEFGGSQTLAMTETNGRSSSRRRRRAKRRRRRRSNSRTRLSADIDASKSNSNAYNDYCDDLNHQWRDGSCTPPFYVIRRRPESASGGDPTFKINYALQRETSITWHQLDDGWDVFPDTDIESESVADSSHQLKKNLVEGDNLAIVKPKLKAEIHVGEHPTRTKLSSVVAEKDDKHVRWVLSHGEDLLNFHRTSQHTLLGITRQVDNFNHFFLNAKREADKGRVLLNEESESSEEPQELTKSLRRHLSSFADRLHLTKDQLEDTAKCYLLLDKAYEWALEAMKVVGRVKSSGIASPEQVSVAANAMGELLKENPPVSDETFIVILEMAERLGNNTLLQQCKMAQSRCEETISLLRSRQSALLKTRRQMDFDCQSFIDLGEVLDCADELTSVSWFTNTLSNNSGRKRSSFTVGSRPAREPLSRCSSVETDDDSVSSESLLSPTYSKPPLEAKCSLGGIEELRESAEDIRGSTVFFRSTNNYLQSPENDFRNQITDCHLSSTPVLHVAPHSTVRDFSSSSSSCSSSDSSGSISGKKIFTKDRFRNSWRFADTSLRCSQEINDSLDESIGGTSVANKSIAPLVANSHLLIRGSQINLSNSEDLTTEEVRKNKTLLLIMQELIQTERDYVNSLEYIIENYIPELLRDDIPQALRGQRNAIFGNIEKIYEFHSGYFLRALENYATRPFSVGSIFLRYESQFYLYALYNKNKPKSDDLMSEFVSTFFKDKQQELGDKMNLSSYLLKPVQRMGKYALLLKQLLKECDRSEEGFEELKSAEEMVQFQLRHGNDLLAMDSLRDCDVNLKEQGRLLRQGEFIVTERNRGRKSIRHVFLFEDLILFSKARKDPEKKTLDVFQYKQSLKTTDIGLTEQVGDNPLKFEIWFRKRKPSDTFVLQSATRGMKEAWTEEISKLLWRQALRNRKLRLCEMSSMGIGSKPCLDIRPSEDQINDRSVSMNKAPRLRLSSSAGLIECSSNIRRPHSVISVSSSASSAESSSPSSAGPSFVGTLNLGFESGDSPKPLQRSVTRTSQCSAESGIMSDIFPDRDLEESHAKVERSNSTATNTSLDSMLSPSSLSHSSFSSPLALPEISPLTLQLHQSVTKNLKTLLTTEV